MLVEFIGLFPSGWVNIYFPVVETTNGPGPEEFHVDAPVLKLQIKPVESERDQQLPILP